MTLPSQGGVFPDPSFILNSIGEVPYTWDLITDQMCWGSNANQVFGASLLKLLSTGTSFEDHIAPESPSSRTKIFTNPTEKDEGQGVAYQIYYCLTPDKRSNIRIWIEDTGRWFAPLGQKITQAHGVIRIITDLYQTIRQETLLSSLDTLTGTLTRPKVIDYLKTLYTRLPRARTRFSFLLLSIDSLEEMNATWGYEVGDEILSLVAQRLRAHLRASDVLGRYSGNKFALILPSCQEEAMQAAAQRYLSLIDSTPFETSAGPLKIQLHIGGATAPTHGRDDHSLILNAESALHATHLDTKTRFVAYREPRRGEKPTLSIAQISEQIVTALNDRRLEIILEPIVNFKTGEAFFYEALLRIRREDNTLLMPAHILPIAEKAGLMRLIDHRILELSLEFLIAHPNVHLSMNVSITSLFHPEWLQDVQSTLSLYPSAIPRLILELTETSIIHDIQLMHSILTALKALGLRLAIDDFGSGHTSFRNLRDLPFDFVKIDGTFIKNFSTSADDRFFVKTLLELAKNLDLITIAEWVEDEETAQILDSWGVPYLQGYFYTAQDPLKVAPPHPTQKDTAA